MAASAKHWTFLAVVLLHTFSSGGNVMVEGTESEITTASSDGPEFQPTVQNITVLTGSTASLNCTVLNLGHHKVVWIHKNSRRILTADIHVVTSDPRISLMSMKGHTYTLVIKDTRPEDSGAYLCQVITHPMRSMRFVIHVADGVDTPTAPGSDNDAARSEKREATEVLPSAAVLAGHTALLRCTLNTNGHDEITWVNEDTGNVLSVGANLNSSDSRFSLRHETNESVKLLIKDVRLEDSGAYACHLSSDPKKTLHFGLRVIDAPAVSSTSMKLNIEQAQLVVTLQCTVHGVPHPFMYWSKDRNTLSVTGNNHEVNHNRREYGKVSTSLIMRNVGADDVGIYRCHAENSLGNRSARFSINKSLINSVVIESAEEGTPTELPDTKENVGKQEEGAHPASPLKDTDPDLPTTSPNLDVADSNVGPSLNMPIKNITAKLGQTVSLNCLVRNLGPYQVLWRRFQRQRVISVGSLILAPSKRYSLIYDAEGTYKLVIKDVRYEDSDIYSCLVTADPKNKLDIFLEVVSM